jgi:hypothetical protein
MGAQSAQPAFYYYQNPPATQPTASGGEEVTAASPTYNFINLSSGPGYYQDRILRRLEELKELIDDRCASLFGGKDAFNRKMNELTAVDGAGNTKGIANAQIAPTEVRPDSGVTNAIASGSELITVNIYGAFFSNDVTTNNGRIQGGTDKAGAFILLHEFGHIMNATGFKSDNGNVEVGKSNNDIIHNNCQDTLRKF